MMEKVSYSTLVNVNYEESLAYHLHDLSIERGIPPSEYCQVEFLDKFEEKEIVSLNFPKGLLVKKWVFERIFLQDGIKGRQVKGPFSFFEHHIKIKKISVSEIEVTDEALYKIPLGSFGKWLLDSHIKKRLLRLFKYRHHVFKKDMEQKALYPNTKPLKILLSGSHGFVGSHLQKTLTLFGHLVTCLVRHAPKDDKQIQWDPAEKKIELKALEGFDIALHLGGENIASLKWTKGKKAKIYKSRVESTAFLAQALNKLQNPPKAFLCASACGFYGKRPGEKLDETSSIGEGFLAHVVHDWEMSAHLFTKGKVATLRFGVVIGSHGGIFQKMLQPYKMGLGAIIGTGQEHMSWISLQDVAYQILFIMHKDSLLGAVNIVSPYPVTGEEFSRTLAKLLHRPLFLKIPAWLIKMVFQEIGEELFLADAKVYPTKLIWSEARFAYPTLKEALENIL